uniref:Uncharacterized protein n=1 Tax=Lactuca sativa TaxID=4236 RepID=A0A9R1XF36_LACSA|nr:hypothetical protein LSAT_V11C500249830 [Lactuca sativa]
MDLPITLCNIIIFIDLNVIRGKSAIIGDTKPFPCKILDSQAFSMAKPAASMQSSISMSKDFVLKTYLWKTISQIKDEKLGTSEKTD